MTQINARDYEILKPGTKGTFHWYGNKPVPVTFRGMDGVEVLIEGQGVRPRWHQGLHEGLLYSAFSWDIPKFTKGGNTTSPTPVRYFITVEWCSNGQRGIFCSSRGVPSRKDGEPHTQEEMDTVLGPFTLILNPKSELFTEEEIAKFTYFRPLAEYTNQYGIALREHDVPKRVSHNPTQEGGDPRED